MSRVKLLRNWRHSFSERVAEVLNIFLKELTFLMPFVAGSPGVTVRTLDAAGGDARRLLLLLRSIVKVRACSRKPLDDRLDCALEDREGIRQSER